MEAILPYVGLLGLLITVITLFTKLERRLTILEVGHNLFWKIVEQKLPSVLLKPVHKRLDYLLSKYQDSCTNGEELKELAVELNHILLNEQDAGKLFAGTLVLASVNRKLDEINKVKIKK